MKVRDASIDPQGNWQRGDLFLKGHANTGIVACQFLIDGQSVYELNVGWHHGESGGPIAFLDPISVIAIMQGYRNVEAPTGKLVGPHFGRSLALIEGKLRELGASIV